MWGILFSIFASCEPFFTTVILRVLPVHQIIIKHSSCVSFQNTVACVVAGYPYSTVVAGAWYVWDHYLFGVTCSIKTLKKSFKHTMNTQTTIKLFGCWELLGMHSSIDHSIFKHWWWWSWLLLCADELWVSDVTWIKVS